jgi:hypothetical protein
MANEDMSGVDPLDPNEKRQTSEFPKHGEVLCDVRERAVLLASRIVMIMPSPPLWVVLRSGYRWRSRSENESDAVLA